MFRQRNENLCPFGVILENKRKKWGMDKTELCRRSDMSVAYYNFIIHGMRKGSDEYRNRLIKVLELENEAQEAS